jgi:ABC-type branched-subunit amino acid transport system permease subunit
MICSAGSLPALIYMVVGGSGKFIGPILGALILTVLPEVMRPLKELEPFFFAAVLMLVIFFMPEGIVGLPGRLKVVAGRLFKEGEGRA